MDNPWPKVENIVAKGEIARVYEKKVKLAFLHRVDLDQTC